MENHRLFEPVNVGSLHLPNRIVMSPMTRVFSPGGVPGENVAAYYRRRAESGVGLIVTEGTWVPHPGASGIENVPCFYGARALEGWARVASEVHAAGGRIMPQLWHTGLLASSTLDSIDDKAWLTNAQIGPSGMVGATGEMPRRLGRAMTQADIDAVIEAFAAGAESAQKLGFDGVALHGGHGYLFDQFFWKETNLRDDHYGGGIAQRTRFACDVIKECRRRTGRNFPLMFRMSQWKLHDYNAKLCDTPQELELFLRPLIDADIDIFDCSQRRFWEPEFSGSDLNLAGWVKKISGRVTMTVGSVGLDLDLMPSLMGQTSKPASLEKLLAMLDRGDFDLVGVGRSLLVDHSWAAKIQRGAHHELLPFSPDALATLS